MTMKIRDQIKYNLRLFLAVVTFPVLAQTGSPEVINSAGSTLNAGGIQMDFSLGEVAIGPLGSEGTLTQGFLQGLEATEEVSCGELFFSEYIEGSALYKGLEIFNNRDEQVDLSIYEIQVFHNGSLVPSIHPLIGVVGPKEVFTIANPSSTLATTSDYATSIAFNGNDAVLLVNTETGQNLDIIGEIGVQPASGTWTVGENDEGSTTNMTLVRKSAVSSGELDWQVSRLQWDVLPQDDFSDFGSHSAAPCDPSECPGYAIDLEEIYCDYNKVVVPIVINEVIKEGIIGLDFTLEYDANVLSATNTVALGDVVHGGTPSIADYHLTNTPGKTSGVIYFTTEAPIDAEFSGSGMIIEITFNRLSGSPGEETTIDLQVRENSMTTVTEVCGLTPQTLPINKEKKLFGSLQYRNSSNKALKYDPNTPSLYQPTLVETVDENCLSNGEVLLPDLNGRFQFVYDENINQLTINRPIAGSYSDGSSCVNMMQWYNGTDRNHMERLATGDPGFSANLFTLMAADVNQDGVISAADITLLNQRIVMNICGFPKVENGQVTVGEDWIFIQRAEISGNPEYTMSTTYPEWDGVGANKDHVPSAQDCFYIPEDAQPLNCTFNIEEKFSAVLLGDVNGNWTPAHGNLVKKGIQEYVLLDVSNAIQEEPSTWKVPLVTKYHTPLEAVDFYFDIPKGVSDLEGELNDQSFDVIDNDRDNVYLFSSYTDNPQNHGEVGYVYLSSEDKQLFQLNGKAFINGEEVALLTQKPVYEEEVSLAPNPFEGYINLNVSGVPEGALVNISITNTTGVVVYLDEIASEGESYFSHRLSLTNLMNGMYYITITTLSGANTYKIVKAN